MPDAICACIASVRPSTVPEYPDIPDRSLTRRSRPPSRTGISRPMRRPPLKQIQTRYLSECHAKAGKPAAGRKNFISKLTQNGVLEDVVAAHAAVQQIHRVLVAQIRGHGVHAGPATALGAAGVRVEHHVPGLPLLARLHVRRRMIVLDAVLAAEYVEVAEDDARDVRRPVRIRVSVLALERVPGVISTSSGTIVSRTRNKNTHFLVALLRAAVRRLLVRDFDGGALHHDGRGSSTGGDLKLLQRDLHQGIGSLLDASYRPHVAGAAPYLREIAEVDDVREAQIRLGDVDGLVTL